MDNIKLADVVYIISKDIIGKILSIDNKHLTGNIHGVDNTNNGITIDISSVNSIEYKLLSIDDTPITIKYTGMDPDDDMISVDNLINMNKNLKKKYKHHMNKCKKLHKDIEYSNKLLLTILDRIRSVSK